MAQDMAPFLVAPIKERKNPVVFFDVTIAGHPAGQLRIELFKTTGLDGCPPCPKTAENFRQFCTGEYQIQKQPVGYKGCYFHRVIKNFMLQGGDFVNGDGTGRVSIYGTTFEDECLEGKHTGVGYLSMANSGPNTNACQFFVTCAKADWLDGKHVVFGKILDDGESLLTLRKCENVPCDHDDKPKMPILIAECGEL